MRPRSLSRARTGAGHAENDPRFWMVFYVMGAVLVVGLIVFASASPTQRRWMVRHSGTPVPGKNGRY